MTSRYDERGNRIEQAYFGVDGQAVLLKEQGYARATWRYDERGNGRASNPVRSLTPLTRPGTR